MVRLLEAANASVVCFRASMYSVFSCLDASWFGIWILDMKSWTPDWLGPKEMFSKLWTEWPTRRPVSYIQALPINYMKELNKFTLLWYEILLFLQGYMFFCGFLVNLAKRRTVADMTCVFCSEVETSKHLLCSCSVASFVWNAISECVGIKRYWLLVCC
jgi:hypothetical protein